MHTRRDQVAALVLAALGIYTVLSGLRMGYRQGPIPGPGFAPVWIGGALAAAAVLLILRSSRIAVAGTETERAGQLSVVLQIMAATAGSIALIRPFGMVPALSLLLLLLVRLMGGLWRTALLAALVLPLALRLVFVVWLGVPFPKGPWGI